MYLNFGIQAVGRGVDMRLTKKQNEVIYCLQNGWVVVTDNTVTGAWIAGDTGQFHINNGVFWRLVDKGLLWQSTHLKDRHCYVLTDKGWDIKTKKVEQLKD
jgi:hypothetical protein